jgi:hypothetical protein
MHWVTSEFTGKRKAQMEQAQTIETPKNLRSMRVFFWSMVTTVLCLSGYYFYGNLKANAKEIDEAITACAGVREAVTEKFSPMRKRELANAVEHCLDQKVLNEQKRVAREHRSAAPSSR